MKFNDSNIKVTVTKLIRSIEALFQSNINIDQHIYNIGFVCRFSKNSYDIVKELLDLKNFEKPKTKLSLIKLIDTNELKMK